MLTVYALKNAGCKGLKSSLIQHFNLLPSTVYFTSFFGTVYEIFICVVCTSVSPIVHVSIFVNRSPLFTAILAVCMLGERLSFWNGAQVRQDLDLSWILILLLRCCVVLPLKSQQIARAGWQGRRQGAAWQSAGWCRRPGVLLAWKVLLLPFLLFIVIIIIVMVVVMFIVIVVDIIIWVPKPCMPWS